MTRSLARLGAATLAVSALIVPATSEGHGKLPTGKYSCYVFYTAGTPTYTGRYITIKSAGKYRWFNSKKTSGGRYSHAASGKLKFKSGPLKGMAGKHRVNGDGTSGVDITFKTSSGPSNYTCSKKS